MTKGLVLSLLRTIGQNISSPGAWCVLLVVAHVSASNARAQGFTSLVSDRARLAEIVGDTSSQVRRTRMHIADVLPILDRPGVRQAGLFVELPEVRVTRNSALPYSLNDGPLWAGRGWNFSLGAGVALEQQFHGTTVHIRVAPTMYYSQNRPFQIFPGTTPGRSAFANPFHGEGASLDLPHRFGDRHLLGFDYGRSSVSVAWPNVVAGVTTENDWWGPGIRNAIVMSNNAAGVPRLFVATARPVRTKLGAFDAMLISGTLTQSLFFSPSPPASENRSLSGVVVQLRPAFDSMLTFGFERVVYRPIGPFASPFTMTLARTFDALVLWESISGGFQKSDQIGGIFARWSFPTAGFEVYGEWARMDPPENFGELFTAPHRSGGWTFGFQWAQPRRNHSYLRLQSELTYLEQSRVFPDRLVPDFYSGYASPQGYTQRGQVVGAAIGPGASSQWLAVDWFAPRWQAGAFVGRIRWDNDAMYRTSPPLFWRHDVSVLSGIRGGWRAPFTDFSAELTVARRYNYLFQNGIAAPGGYRTVDVNNVTLALVATPR